MDTIIDTKQAHELSAVIEQAVELVKKDKKDRVVVYIIDFNIFEAVPANWCEEQFKGWKEIVRVCAG